MHDSYSRKSNDTVHTLRMVLGRCQKQVKQIKSSYKSNYTQNLSFQVFLDVAVRAGNYITWIQCFSATLLSRFQEVMISSTTSLAIGTPFNHQSVFDGAFATVDPNLTSLLTRAPFSLFVTSSDVRIGDRPAAHYLMSIFTAVVGPRRASVRL